MSSALVAVLLAAVLVLAAPDPLCASLRHDILRVKGVDILSPNRTDEYRRAQTVYWRTVLSLPAKNNPLNPSEDTPDAGCPKAISECNHKVGRCDETYLITGVVLTGTAPANRTCYNIPRGKRVIINLNNDLEWYSPPIDSSFLFGNPEVFNSTVRLTPDSLCSLAQAFSDLDPTCIKVTINGEPVPITKDFYHISPFVCDMDISPGFYQTLGTLGLLGSLGAAETRTLLRKGINNTDECDAGYYLVLPYGFTKPGKYVLTFGQLEGCAEYTNTWWQKGFTVDGSSSHLPSSQCKDESSCKYNQNRGLCWPDRVGCTGGFYNITTPAKDPVGITYTIYVN